MLWEILFTAAALPLVATYFGYPLGLWIAARIESRRARTNGTHPIPPDNELPTVSILVAAHNEEAVIEAKLRNFFSLDYPREKLDLAIVSDASADETCARAHALLATLSQDERRRVTVHDRTQRSGKTIALSETVPETSGSIIVFSDANTLFRPDAILRLARRFQDPRVGLACGQLRYTGPTHLIKRGEAIYWRYEHAIKRWEGQLGRLLVANGSIYGFRRELFEPIPGPVADDMVVPLIVASKGYETVYEEEAIAEERIPERITEDFRGKARIVAQGFEAMTRYRRQILSLGGWRVVQFLFHKTMRWLALPFMSVMLVTSLLGESPFLHAMLVGQLGFYAIALLGIALHKTPFLPAVVRIPAYFCLVNTAAFLGFIDFSRRKDRSTWDKSESTRAAEGGGAHAKKATRPLRILILSQYFPPDITAAAFRIGETADLLVAAGHEVCVVTAEPHKALVEGKPHSLPELSESLRVYRTPVHPSTGNGLVPYLRHYLSFVFGSLRQGIRVRRSGWRPDVVWASSPPLFVSLSGYALSRRFRCPLVLDIRDIWPDSAVAAEQISATGLAYRIGRVLEKWSYRVAAHLTCVSKPMATYLERQSQTPVTVVYNGVLPPTRKLPGTDTARLHDRIIYAGNYGRVQGLDVLIDVFADLQDTDTFRNWELLLIGSGVLKDSLEEMVRTRGLEKKIRISPPMPKEDALDEMCVSRLLFLNLKGDEVFKLTIPSKVFDYMLAARPILGGIEGEGRAILEATGANVSFTPNDKDSLRSALRTALAELPRLEKNAPSNRDVVLAEHGREASVRSLISTFENVIRSPAS